MKSNLLITGLTFVFFFLATAGVFANKTSVTIEAPATAKIGEEITITINVKHMGNTAMHFTDWVWLKVNGEEVKRWSFSKTVLPKEQNFKLTFTVKVTGDMKIDAEGHCNLHGSEGIASAVIKAIQ
jgi:desulfoferrodoxin (superoxide reductase-like protein)